MATAGLAEKVRRLPRQMATRARTARTAEEMGPGLGGAAAKREGVAMLAAAAVVAVAVAAPAEERKPKPVC